MGNFVWMSEHNQLELNQVRNIIILITFLRVNQFVPLVVLSLFMLLTFYLAIIFQVVQPKPAEKSTNKPAAKAAGKKEKPVEEVKEEPLDPVAEKLRQQR